MTTPDSRITFKVVELYGGAIVVELPETFEDVSQIRQVPDHQEVHLDRLGFSSIAFDILERVPRDDDVEALKFHLHDLVEEDASATRVQSVEAKVQLGKMPGVKALTLAATCPPGEKMRGRANEPRVVGVGLLLVRLEGKWKTDVLCAVNVPQVVGEHGEGGEDAEAESRLLEMGCRIRQRVVDTLEIRDWGLFGEE